MQVTFLISLAKRVRKKHMLLSNLKNKEDTESRENPRKPEGGTKS